MSKKLLMSLVAPLIIAAAATLALAMLPAPSPARANRLASRHGALRIPVSLAAAASASIGASEHAFWPVRHGSSLLAQGGGIQSTFSASGAALRVAQGTLDLSLAAVGHGQRLQRVAAANPSAAASQVLYRQGSIGAFYRGGPYGLEQGFTVQRRPEGNSGSLVLELRIGGSLIPGQAGSEVLFRTHAGAKTLHYGQLSATDAAGRQLPAAIELHNGTLQLRIDDRDARYPLRIDPFIQQGEKLTGTGESGEGGFGESVALSAEGNTALIGGPNDNGFVGAAWVFTRSGSTWTQQGEKLTGGGESGAGEFGSDVALSADGDTALIGSRSAAAWVFTRSGSTWTQQGEKLTASPGAFGISVALSADGNTALIGGSGDSSLAGAAWVFTRSGSTWTQGEKLTAGGESGNGSFGRSVALSSEGNTALIGGPDHDGQVGAAWVFTRSGSTWSQQGEKLTGSSESGEGLFGESVALSADGNTALVGGEGDNSETGAAWVFTRSGSTWSQQGEKLTATGESGKGRFGRSVALSADGNTALIGGPFDHGEAGAAWVFVRSGSTWSQEGEKLTASGECCTAVRFGHSVALSSSGSTALIGGPSDFKDVGAAWAFVSQPEFPTVVTEPASALTETSGTLNATVNPNGGEVTKCEFEYGTSNSYGKTAPCASLPGSGESPVAVSASISGLSANTTYHFRIIASNATGTSYGSDEMFDSNLLTVVTNAASAVTPVSAKLNGTVNPNGQEVTRCNFEYATSGYYEAHGKTYEKTASCASLPGSGSSPVPVSASVTGLTTTTTYHFRVVATNSTGAVYGRDETFTTTKPVGPHYFRNSGGTFSKATKVAEGVKVPVIEWGNLEFVESGPALECQIAVGGYIENPKGATPGVGATELFNAYNCKNASCLVPDFTSVQARNLNGEHETSTEGPFGNGNQVKWPSVLQEREVGVIRTNISNVSMLFGCRDETGKLVAGTFVECFTEPGVDEDTPLWTNGTGIGSKPSRIEYGVGDGSLNCSEAFKIKTGKSLKVMGYNEQEIIEVGE